MDLKSKIRTVPDFPKKGIMFKDITTLLQDPQAFRESIREMKRMLSGAEFDSIAAMESRGFIFGAVLAHDLGKGFIPLRKPGKLPFSTVSHSYEKEYGTDSIEIHRDAVRKGERILIVDDLLATGGTAKASAQLIEKLGGIVAGAAFLIELSFLKGRERLKGYKIYSLLNYRSGE